MLYNQNFLKDEEVNTLQSTTYIDKDVRFPWIFDNETKSFFHHAVVNEKRKSIFTEDVKNIINKYKDDTLVSIQKIVNASAIFIVRPDLKVYFQYENPSLVYFVNDSGGKLDILKDGDVVETLSAVAGRAAIVNSNQPYCFESTEPMVVIVVEYEGKENEFKVSERHKL
jgi:hypothetical protein